LVGEGETTSTTATAKAVHKAQGLTTQVALRYGASALCQQAGYVAMSRSREANHLYTSHGSLRPDISGVELGAGLEGFTANPADVARALADYRRQVLALDQQPDLLARDTFTPNIDAAPYQWLDRERHVAERGRSR
jgi:hypothetical protein